MGYNQAILNSIELLDSVLKELDKPSVFQNSDFLIDDFSSDDYLRLCVVKKDYAILDISFSLFDIQIDIDRETEVFLLSNDYIAEHPNDMKDIFRDILTKYLKVEYFGKGYTRISYCDSLGNASRRIKVISSFYLKWNCKITQYDPIY